MRHLTKTRKHRLSLRLDSGSIASPDATAPEVPAAAPVAYRPRRKALDAQVAGATAMADELERASSYVAEVGSHAPDRLSLAADLRAAHAWSLEQARTDAWQHHVAQQREIAWDVVLGEIAKLQSEFEHAAANDPSLPARFPATAAFLAARRTIAQRANVTKAKNKKTAAKKDAEATAPDATKVAP